MARMVDKGQSELPPSKVQICLNNGTSRQYLRFYSAENAIQKHISAKKVLQIFWEICRG